VKIRTPLRGGEAFSQKVNISRDLDGMGIAFSGGRSLALKRESVLTRPIITE